VTQLDTSVDAIRRALAAEGDVSDSDARWIVDLHVFTRLNEANVHDVLKLLAYEFPAMNRALWAAVNKAPRIESDWEGLFFIGSNMSDEDQRRSRSQLRRAVELVRSATLDTRDGLPFLANQRAVKVSF
jgi:hypothetical protein